MLDYYRRSLIDLADHARTDVECVTHTLQLLDQFRAETGCDPDANLALLDAFKNNYRGAQERRAKRMIDILADAPPQQDADSRSHESGRA